MSMTEIEQKTRDYASARDLLNERMRILNDELQACKRRKLNGIISAARSAGEARSKLQAAIEEHPTLFVKPKSITIQGVKVGFQKKKDTLDIADAEKTIKLIKSKMADMADILIITKEKPDIGALLGLGLHDLKRLGVKYVTGTDEAYIKHTDTEIDKLVDAMLAEFDDSEESTE